MTLKEWLKSRSIGHMELAADFGVALRTVYEWTERSRSPRLEIAVKIVERSEGAITYPELLAWRGKKLRRGLSSGQAAQ